AASEIVVNTPLPPLVNPHGVVLDATRSHARLIVAATPDAGPILDLAAPNSLVTGLRIVNAPAEGILIRAADVRLQDVTIEASQIGVFLADDVSNISITESAFLNNEIGVQVPASAAGITIQGNRFQDHRRAAVWAVAPVARPESESQLKIVRNRFKNDNQSMLVINGNVRIDGNVIEGARASAAFVSGAAAIVEENRIRAGFGF